MAETKIIRYPNFKMGDRVCLRPECTNYEEDPMKYFVLEFCEGYYVLADTVEDLNNLTGRMYGIEDIFVE